MPPKHRETDSHVSLPVVVDAVGRVPVAAAAADGGCGGVCDAVVRTGGGCGGGTCHVNDEYPIEFSRITTCLHAEKE